MARLPCKQSSSPSQQTRVNNFGNSRNLYWDMQQARHPAPSYVRNHHRHTDYTGESSRCIANVANRIANRCVKAPYWRTYSEEEDAEEKEISTCVFRIVSSKSCQMRNEFSCAGASRTSESASLCRQKRKNTIGFDYTVACELIRDRFVREESIAAASVLVLTFYFITDVTLL